MFDLLYIKWNVNPEIFHIGGIQIRWYSLLFVSGFILGWFIVKGFFKREGLKLDLLDPLLYTLLIATIVGARLGHCLFYQPDYYLGSWEGFKEIFMPWKGGLASHGGTIAIFLAMWWFARKYGPQHGFDLLWLLDRIVIPICFAGALIRIGNLFNSEIYGSVTDLPWGIAFVRNAYDAAGHLVRPDELLPHHPTQLYEALSYVLLGFFLLWLYFQKLDKIHRGTIFGLFFIILWSARFLIEFIKNDQVDFEAGMALNMGQLLSIPFILAGVGVVIYSVFYGKTAKLTPPDAIKAKKKEETHYARSL